MYTFSSRNIELRYKIVGHQGPFLFCLHGFGGAPSDFDSVQKHLSVSYRLVLVNLKTFFSSLDPMSFSTQVDILCEFIKHLIQNSTDEKRWAVLGQSYGGMLSLGVVLHLQEHEMKRNLVSLALLNPMPFHPLDVIEDKHVKIILGFGNMHGGLGTLGSISKGRECLIEVAKIFRIGAIDNSETHRTNRRKLILVEKALQRFIWIDRNEKWEKWRRKMALNHIQPIIFYSNQDPLFSPISYQNYQNVLPNLRLHQVNHAGHLLLQDLGAFLDWQQFCSIDNKPIEEES